MSAPTIRQLGDQLDEAFRLYAHDNGDGYSRPDWMRAYEVREEGYRVAEEAFALPEDDRSFFIEAQADKAPKGDGYLMLCAAEFRVAELMDNRRNAELARAA